MNYDFTQEIKYRFPNFVTLGFDYQENNKISSSINHEEGEFLPWHSDDLKYPSNYIDGHLKFSSKDDGFGASRYRFDLSAYSSDININEVNTAIIESRCKFLQHSLNGIDIVPGSFTVDKGPGGDSLLFKGTNNERISMIKRTRGRGYQEGIILCVAGNNKWMKVDNDSSFSTDKHSLRPYPDVYEERISSRCESHGQILTDNGIYIFCGDYVKKDGDIYSYPDHPNFSVVFYDNELLTYLNSEQANGLEDIASTRKYLRDGGTDLKEMLIKYGYMPSFEISIDCTNSQIVDFANQMYNDPDAFVLKQQQKQSHGR